jgi:transcriptional regulator with XRE-family HTH domain
MRLAEMVGSSASYIGEIEIGRKFPSVELIEKIALALNIEPHSLFIEEKAEKSLRVLGLFAQLDNETKADLVEMFGHTIQKSLKKVLFEPPDCTITETR